MSAPLPSWDDRPTSCGGCGAENTLAPRYTSAHRTAAAGGVMEFGEAVYWNCRECEWQGVSRPRRPRDAQPARLSGEP